MKHLILLSVIVSLLGCSHVPTNVDLSSYLTQPIPGTNQRAAIKSHGQSAELGINQRDRLLHIARQLEQKGDHQAAIKRYEQVTDAFPNDVELLHHLAVLQDKYGDPAQSEGNYLRALQHNPNDAELVCDYGYSRYIQGDLVQAEVVLRRAVAMDANLWRGYNNLGLVLAEQGKDKEALAAFEKTGLSSQEARENLRQARIAAHLSSSQEPM